MNSLMIHRLRGPAYLLLIGILALLDQADILGWGKSWPLFLILAGVLALAERAVASREEPLYPGTGPNNAYPGYQPTPGSPYGSPAAPYAEPYTNPAPTTPAASATNFSGHAPDQSTAIVPVEWRNPGTAITGPEEGER